MGIENDPQHTIIIVPTKTKEINTAVTSLYDLARHLENGTLGDKKVTITVHKDNPNDEVHLQEALFYAAKSGNKAIAALLLANGAKPHCQLPQEGNESTEIYPPSEIYQKTPYQVAKDNDKRDIVALFDEHSA